jgi:hypothetical protein
MTLEDIVYMFLMDEHPYFFEQHWHFGQQEECGDETAVSLFTKNKDDDGRRLISKLTFDELCRLKETVDEVFENLLPRYRGNTDDANWLLSNYPWLEERADVNPLFGSGEKREEEE